MFLKYIIGLEVFKTPSNTLHIMWYGIYTQVSLMVTECRITLSEVFDGENKLPDGTLLCSSADYPVITLNGKSQGSITLGLTFERDEEPVLLR